MIKHAKFGAAFAVLLASAPVIVYSFSGGPPIRRSNVPGEGNCTACHAGSLNPAGGKVEVVFPGSLTYTPGVKQTLRVVVTDPAAAVFGFQLTARLSSDERNKQAGSLEPAAGETGMVVFCANGSIKQAGAACPTGSEIEHISHNQPRAPGEFRVDWTPPAAGAGQVKIYVVGNGANGNGTNSGDHIYASMYELQPAAVGPVPTIAAERGVVNGASFEPGLTPGAWASIFGENLAPSTRRWRDSGPDSEIVNGQLPRNLDGVSVTIDGKPAAVSYISPGQLNVQVPNDAGIGSVQVQVTTAQGNASVPVTVFQTQPAFFKFGDTAYVAAQHENFTNIGPNGRFDANTAPARGGEEIILYGTGFGATTPATPSGVVVTSANQIDKSQLTVRIGNQPANVTFAGITIAGVWQIQVVVPQGLAAGDQPIVAEFAGRRSQDNARITLQ